MTIDKRIIWMLYGIVCCTLASMLMMGTQALTCLTLWGGFTLAAIGLSVVRIDGH